MKKERRIICDTDRSAYKQWTSINLRYGDTDRQGHINNAVYCTLFESGRVDFLFDETKSIAGPGTAFVIARLALDYLEEMHFPGIAEVGSKIIAIGTSSFTVGQAVFYKGKCCSTSESIIVLIDEAAGKPIPITDTLEARLKLLL